VKGFAKAGLEAFREGGWDCGALEALRRELERLASLLRADLLEEARLYGEPPSLGEALEKLDLLLDAAGGALKGCRSSGL